MLFRSDRKSTRLNSSHTIISYAVFCLKKKKESTLAHRRRCAPPPAWTRRPSRPPGQPRHQRLLRLPADYHLRLSVRLCFFFLNNPGPPELTLFPLPAVLPI